MDGLRQDCASLSVSPMYSEKRKDTAHSLSWKDQAQDLGAVQTRASSQPPVAPAADARRARWHANDARRRSRNHPQSTSGGFQDPGSRRNSKVSLQPLSISRRNDSAASSTADARGTAQPIKLDLAEFGFNSPRFLLGSRHRHLVGPPGLFSGCVLPEDVFSSATVPCDILASIVPVPKPVAQYIKEGLDWHSSTRSDKETIALRSWLQAELETVYEQKETDLRDALEAALKLYQLVHNTLSEKVMANDKQQGRLLFELWRSQAAVAHNLLSLKDTEISTLKGEIRQQLEDNKIVVDLLNEKQQQKKIVALQVELSNCNTENLALKKRVAKLEQSICDDSSASSWFKQLERENEDIRARNEMLLQQLHDMQIQQMIADESHEDSFEKHIGVGYGKTSAHKKPVKQSRIHQCERGGQGTMEQQMISHVYPRSISALGICPWDEMHPPRD